MNGVPARAVRHWCGVKGKGGRKKQSNTQGHACPNRACEYNRIRDQIIHALVLQVMRGKTGAIWRLRCRASGRCFSERHNTVLAHLKASPDTISTAYIERFNLILRQMVAPLARKTWSLAQSPDHLMRHVEWACAYIISPVCTPLWRWGQTSPGHSGSVRPPWRRD